MKKIQINRRRSSNIFQIQPNFNLFQNIILLVLSIPYLSIRQKIFTSQNVLLIIVYFTMFHSTTKTYFQKLIEEYQLQINSPKEELNEIVLVFLESLNKPQILAKYQKDIEIYCNVVKRKIAKRESFAGLNFAILLHFLLIKAQQYLKESVENRLKILELIDKCLVEINVKDKNTRQAKTTSMTYFHENILFSYFFYFQKKIQFLELKLLGQIEKQKIQLKKQCQTNQKSMDVFFRDKQAQQSQTKIKLQKHYEQCYKRINLLNNGLAITKEFLMILRYYHSQKQTLSELNRILAYDFSKLYEKISSEIGQIKKIQELFDIESLEYSELMKEIQKINQKMFIIYLNRYNGYILCGYAPKWISVQLKYSIKKPKEQKKQLKRLNTEMISMESCQSIEDQIELPRKSRSKTLFTCTQIQEKCNSEIQTRQTLLEISQKEKQRLSILSQLENNFKKYYSKEEPSNLGRDKTRFKKNKSFYQAKMPSKLQ